MASTNFADGPSAIIVGGSIAGLLTAHSFCKAGFRVTLLDSDPLKPPTGSAWGTQGIAEAKHPSIPQYCHPHALATGGLQAMEKMVPGIHEELLKRGGADMDLGRDLRFFDFGAPYVRCKSSALRSVGATRHMVHSTLLELVLARNAGRLTARDGCRVTGLVWNDDKSAVLGVVLESGERLNAGVVVIASGRSSRLPQWLSAAGHQTPPVQKVDAKVAYVTRYCKMPEDWEGDWSGHITMDRPHGVRGAGMLPAEAGIWQLFVWGINGLVPPTDDKGFMAYLRDLPDQEIYKAACRSQPLTSPKKYGGAHNRQLRWDQVPPPPGLLVLGDAAQAVNPIYGQGMSVAAQSALALDGALQKVLAAAGEGQEAREAAVRAMGPAFQKQLAGVIAGAWALATAEDMRYPETTTEGMGSSKTPWIMEAYLNTVIRACHRDPKAIEFFFGIAQLVRPPTHLFHPRLLWAVACEVAIGAGQQLWSLLTYQAPAAVKHVD